MILSYLYQSKIIGILSTCLFYCIIGNAQESIKENLGTNINTSYPDTKPIISPDGNTLYFTRQFHPDNVKGVKDAQDIYYSTNQAGAWSKAKNIGSPLNDKYPNGVSAITPDGNTMLVLNSYTGDEVEVRGVSIAKKQGSGWSNPQMLNIENFYNHNQYEDYYISNNEKELLLAVERDDTHGDQDLYISFRISEYRWTEPISLGPTINTEYAEFSPFLAADNKTLFFASEGHGSKGSSDIFYSKRLDDSWQKWSKPANLGDINTKEFEAYYTIPASGEYAYYVSTKGSKNASRDIFRTTIPYQFLPDPVLFVSGTVFDKTTRETLPAKIPYSALTNSKEAGTAKSAEHNGTYKIILPRGYTYRYLPVAKGYYGIAQYLNVKNIKEYKELENNLYLVAIKVGSIIPTHDIYFVEGNNKISSKSNIELKRVLQMMYDYPGLQIKIKGYSNDIMDEQENFELSEQRANSLKKYMINNGIHEDRMITQGRGRIAFRDKDISLNDDIDPIERIEIEILALDWTEPKVLDTDGDGIDDENDECPKIKGPVSLKGCPDSDGDTVPDHRDDCPNTPGIPSNKGCPEIAKDVREVFDAALEGIVFETNKDIIKPQSFPILDKVIAVLDKYPDYSLKISGHTDNQGDDQSNMVLSTKRANATKQYLIEKGGISSSRLEAVGYGESVPIASNETKEGRALNRRVAFEVIFD